MNNEYAARPKSQESDVVAGSGLGDFFEQPLPVSGVTGSLSGYVLDAESKKPLAGVNVIIEDTEYGGVTDKNGYYVINNIPAGTYAVRTSMLGYAPYKITGVVIKTDLITRVDFELKLKAFMLEPDPSVVVTAKRFPVKKETLSSSVYLSANDLSRKLPIDNYIDSFKFLSGVYGTHFRGGRSRDVLFLLDGVPILDPLTRDVAFNLPTSSISEILVHKGGFSAEYGNAVAGVVNIISKRGRNNFSLSARTYTDNPGLGSIPHEDTRRLEIGFGGPMTVSFGGPVVEMNYFLAADVNLSNGPFEAELRPFYEDPIKANYNLFGVYDVRLSRNMRLSLQGVWTRWRWRGIDPMFPNDLQALPLRHNRRWRLTSMLTHTLTPTMFYYVTAGITRFNDTVEGQPANEQPPILFSAAPLSRIESTPFQTTPWDQSSRQAVYYLHASLLKQITNRLHLKTGLKGEYYEVSFDADRYIDLPAKDRNGFLLVKRSSHFTRYPRYIAAYGELRYESPRVKIQLGGRFDYLNVNTFPLDRPLQDTTQVSEKMPGKYMFSPRVAVSLPAGARHQLRFNYGRFVQIPPLYYFYAGHGQPQNDGTFWPLLGSLDIKPVSATNVELSYLYTIDAVSTVSITAFRRHYLDLIGTLNSRAASSFEPASQITTFYENAATSRASGLEMELDFSLSPNTHFKLIYTYMQATGTANRSEDGYFQFVNYGFIPTTFDRSLNWDQRHSFILEGHLSPWPSLQLTGIARTYSSRRWLANTLAQEEFKSLPWRSIIDLRLSYTWRSSRFRISPYFDVRNLFNARVDDFEEVFYLINNQPFKPFEEYRGRRVRIGIQIN